MAKNANGEGSIYKRMRDGKVIRYEGAVTYIGDDGKTKRHTVYGRTRQDVRDKLRKARERLDAGAPVRDATRTVADWLAQWRATTLAVSDRKPVHPRAVRAPVAQTSGAGAVRGDHRWTGCGPPTSKLWCSSARTAGCRIRRCARCTRCCGWRWTGRSATDCWHAIRRLWSSGRVWRAGRPDTPPPWM